MQNSGISGVLRAIFVATILTIVAAKGGGPLPLALWIASWLTGWWAGKWLAIQPEQRYKYLQVAGGVLMGSAILLGFVAKKFHLDETLQITCIVTSVGLYLSAYLSFMSDSRVEVS